MNSTQKFQIASGIFALILISVIIWGGQMLIRTVDTSIRAGFAPLTNANSALSTQVSNLLHPTPTVIPDPISIIYEVRSLARLETIQYSVEKVITAEANQGIFGPLVGDKLLFVAHGYVIAGIDLSRLSADDMKLENGTLTVHLPEAEIFVSTLDNQKSYVYDRETGIFSKGMTELETKARQAAEEEIHKTAVEDGILDQATTNAKVFLERIFNQLGYERVVFVQK
jgi:hypothetical protein